MHTVQVIQFILPKLKSLLFEIEYNNKNLFQCYCFMLRLTWKLEGKKMFGL